MDYSQELNKKIEQYAAGMLKGRDLLEFEAKLEADAELKKETLFRKSVIDAIREVRLLELKKYIKAQSKIRLASNPWGKVWTVASIIIVVIAASFYFFDLIKNKPQENTVTDTPAPVVAPTIAVNEPDTITASEDSLAGEPVEEPLIEYTEENIHNTIKEEEIKTAEADVKKTAADSSLQESENNEEIIVKRDQLLATINLKAIEKSVEKHLPPENITSTTVEKLNPEAKLPEPSPQQDLYRVELWKSPINFRGYRLVKNRLTLFGVEQHVILRLYKIDDELYLEYGPAQFSKLYPGDQFNAFVKVSDPEILSQLSQ